MMSKDANVLFRTDGKRVVLEPDIDGETVVYADCIDEDAARFIVAALHLCADIPIGIIEALGCDKGGLGFDGILRGFANLALSDP